MGQHEGACRLLKLGVFQALGLGLLSIPGAVLVVASLDP